MTKQFVTNYPTTRVLRKRKLETEVERPTRKRARTNAHRPQLSMNNLPNELLWEVFSYLDRDSLLKATLVNKNWNSLIVGTTLNDKVNRLYITAQKVDDHVPDLTRKYRSVRFDDVIEWKPELMAQLRAIGEGITEVTFAECVFFDDDLAKLLQIFPNAKFMEISCCYEGIVPTPMKVSTRFARIRMKSLKTLVLRGYSWPLWHISTPNLERFEAETLGMEDQDNLISFLNRQESLKTLHLVDIKDLFDSRRGTLKPQFKLKEVALVNLPFLDSTQLIRFLRHMRDSVELVDIGLEMSGQVCEYILMNFSKIRDMKLDYECLPRSRSFYHKLEVNNNLKYMSLYGNVRSCKPLVNFLRKRPRIEELAMSELHGLHPQYFEFWRQFSSLVPHLHTLALRRINVYNMVFIKLKSLKHLDVDYIGYATDNIWIDFCKNNPGIEDFHIFSRYQEYFTGIRNIILGNLKSLRDLFISN